jgi:hypothetical protein
MRLALSQLMIMKPFLYRTVRREGRYGERRRTGCAFPLSFVVIDESTWLDGMAW